MSCGYYCAVLCSLQPTTGRAYLVLAVDGSQRNTPPTNIMMCTTSEKTMRHTRTPLSQLPQRAPHNFVCNSKPSKSHKTTRELEKSPFMWVKIMRVGAFSLYVQPTVTTGKG